MKYLIVAAVAASMLAGCADIGIESGWKGDPRVFNSGDSNGPRGGDPHYYSGASAGRPPRTQLAPTTPN